jgi:hypothetical protein
VLPDIETSPYAPIALPCGSVAYFDYESGMSHRCQTCFAVVGSVGMPRSCKAEFDMIKVVDKLKGTK